MAKSNPKKKTVQDLFWEGIDNRFTSEDGGDVLLRNLTDKNGKKITDDKGHLIKNPKKGKKRK